MPRRVRSFTAALRRSDAGSVSIVAILVAMALVSLFSWWQLTRAADARRRASDEAVREYASYSARMFAEGAYRAFEVIRLRALLPALAASARGGPRPSLESFSAGALAELEKAGIGRRDAGVGTFVARPARGELRGTGAMADPALRARVVQAIRGATPSVLGLVPVHFAVIQEPPITVAFLPVRAGASDTLVYGFTVDRTVWWSTLGDDVTRHLPLLPATFVDPSWRFLTDPQRLDTLVAISARDAAGRVHYESRPPFAGGMVGTFDALNGPAAIRVELSLHPAMEALLRRETRQAANIGPVLRLPGSRARGRQIPVNIALPLLSIVFVVVAGAQLWRQRSLARARRDFVAAVSHELRTPLAQMRLYTETLQLGRSDDDAERRRWLGIVAREARKLGNIVDNILAFAHLDARRARLEREPTDVGELVEEVVEAYATMASSHGTRLLADAPSRLVANVDPRAIRQAVSNLIDNAIKFGPSGQTVTIDVQRVEQVVRITVTDQGPGIPAERERAIWQPFNSTRVGGGTGIGLAVARGLVLEHGGRISAGPAPGASGACFAIELPLHGVGAPHEARARNGRRPARSWSEWWRRREVDAGAVGLSAILIALTLLSLVTTGALRYAWVTQQEATDRAIREYAAFGARLFYDRAFGVFESLRLVSLGPVERGGGSAPPPSLADVAGAARAALARAGLPMTREVGFFHLDLRSGAYEGVDGANDRALAEPILRAVVEAESLAVPPSEPVRWMALLDRDPQLTIGYGIPPGSAEAYGLVAPRVAIWDVVGRAILRELLLLPPSLTSPNWRWLVDAPQSNYVFALTLTDPSGRVFFSSRPPFAKSPVGEFDVRNIPGGALATVTLHPVVVSGLRDRFNAPQRAVMYFEIPGIPIAARLDLLLAVLSLLLLAAVFLQLRRERSLARARRDFVASVSHELRTPLAQMRMFTETLQLGRERDAEERARWLGVISRETRRLGDLVENILLFSHLGADASRLETERTDLGELVEEVVEATLPLAAQRGMSVLADAPSGMFVRVDPRAMRQIVVNLLDNALKYGPSGQTVRIRVWQKETEIELSVEDEGPGIPPGDRGRIWEPFVRLGRYAGTTAGSGIGLAVVRGLVERHGGRIRIEDVGGGGARFVVSLGIAPSANDGAQSLAQVRSSK